MPQLENGKLKRHLIAIAFIAILSISCDMGLDTSKTISPPLPPRNLRVSILGNGVELIWDPVLKATKYTVFWGSEDGEFRNLADTTQLSMKLPSLKKGQRYNFAVSAWNEKGESDYSKEVVILNDHDPALAPHYLDIGNQLLERGNYLDALLYFTTAIRLDPKNPEAYNSRGRLNEKLSRFELAERDYQKARSLSSESAKINHSVGSQPGNSERK
jgi:tetratricopeptide (TPR) repeat protein